MTSARWDPSDREFLRLVCQGLPLSAIADRLELSMPEAQARRDALQASLQAKTWAELIEAALRRDLGS